MEADEKWYFSKEQLSNTPSRKCGYDGDRELSCRQQAANFIQDMGQRLQVTQLCINTAIVYMHRFYVFHSFTHFHRNAMAAAALFLAAKVEEQPRKLEHVIKVAQMCLHRELPALDTKSEQYLEQAQDLVMNENVLLQTLGFDVAIDHPHTHVVRCCHLVKASKDLAQTSYFMASNSLHLTTMCLQYKPTVVACFCIHLACKWSNWEIPLSNESKSWFWYVDRSVSQELLEQLTDEFLRIFDKCPSRLKRKISANQNMTGYHMGVNELNQKPGRMPGPGGDPGVGGVSFQQPTARPPRPPAEDNRKKQDNNMLSMSHRPMPGPGPGPGPDFKKQPPPMHTGQREMSVYGQGGYQGGPSTSHQFQYPLSAPQRPKHAVRPEATFPPPKQPPVPRPVKTEMPPPQHQPPPKHFPNFPHQAGARNGTSHLENLPHKNETKYPMDKHHQKSHSKSYDARLGGAGWVPDVSNRNVPNDKYKMETPIRTERPYMKTDIKTEPYSNESYHTSINFVKQEPPLPPPPLVPPVPPPPPAAVNPHHHSKPSSIFSPDKTTPPPPDSPLRDVKPVVQSGLMLSPPPPPNRSRTTSSSSEPELIPVMPKLEDISGFESIGKGMKAIKLPGKVPDQHHKDKRKDVSVNNVKQEPSQPDTVDSKPLVPEETVDLTKREHKKKKKHKEHREHREHKDKDRDKDKEKKKDKHKERHKDKRKDVEAKDKEKERPQGNPAPIRITIPKDKLNIKKIEENKKNCLKIKIPKDKIKDPVDQPKSSNSLKIKIRPNKDSLSSSSSSSSSKKRERSYGEDNKHSHPTKHAKTSKTNGDYRLAE